LKVEDWKVDNMGVERFEDLEIWKLSREMVKSIYKITALIKDNI